MPLSTPRRVHVDQELAEIIVRHVGLVVPAAIEHLMMMQGERHNLPDFQRFCYYRGLPFVLQSNVTPTPQEVVE